MGAGGSSGQPRQVTCQQRGGWQRAAWGTRAAGRAARVDPARQLCGDHTPPHPICLIVRLYRLPSGAAPAVDFAVALTAGVSITFTAGVTVAVTVAVAAGVALTLAAGVAIALSADVAITVTAAVTVAVAVPITSELSLPSAQPQPAAQCMQVRSGPRRACQHDQAIMPGVGRPGWGDICCWHSQHNQHQLAPPT